MADRTTCPPPRRCPTQELATSRVTSAFKNLLPSQALVIRDGSESTVAAPDLVIGDVVRIRTGTRVPADVRLIHVSDFKVCTSEHTNSNLSDQRLSFLYLKPASCWGVFSLGNAMKAKQSVCVCYQPGYPNSRENLGAACSAVHCHSRCHSS
jgi:hypothetical protein